MEEDWSEEKNVSKVSESSECMVCLKSQICFISFDRVSGFREQSSAVDVMHLDFSGAFVQAYHDIIVDKMEKYGLNDSTIR